MGPAVRVSTDSALTVRVSTDSAEDRIASSRLSSEAFGYPAQTDPDQTPPLNGPGRTMYLATRDGRVVGKCLDRHYDSWFGGRTVPTCGVASVTVATEERGRGTMRALMTGLMAGARERGAAISTLVPTAPGAYRPFGYESITTFDFVKIPTAQLARVTTTGGSTRRATIDDWPAIEAVYDTWAAAQNGPLTRRGPSFDVDPATVLTERTFTLALNDADTIVGFTSWRHTGGYYGDGLLEVSDIIATTAQGYRQLLAALGSSYAVAPTTEYMSSGSSGLDLVRLVMPDRPWPVSDSDHYMLAILDVPAAFSARGYPRGLDLSVSFGVAGAAIDGVDGAYVLTVSDGIGTCHRVDQTPAHAPTFTPGGLALLYAGAQNCATLTSLGAMTPAPTGSTGEADTAGHTFFDALFTGPAVHIRDSF